jgi:sugar/nucleoside kinase (ribokinase family)
MSRSRTSRSGFDVLGIGCTAVDEILYVPEYPAGDGKMEVRQRERHCGGLCATALVAAARLGARCAFAGTLGDDEDSRFVLQTLTREGIDCRQVVRQPKAGPVRSIIVVDETRRTRTIFFDTRQAVGAYPSRPARSVILGARVLLVDRFGIPGMIRAARMARAAGIPVVADFESSHLSGFKELLALSDHLILSRDFACDLTDERTPQGAATKLWSPTRSAVVITAGAEGCWFRDSAENVKHCPAFEVAARDTTGCGDVFHGAYAFGLARGMAFPARVELASATAALKATAHGGQAGIPRYGAVRKFLRSQQEPASDER